MEYWAERIGAQLRYAKELCAGAAEDNGVIKNVEEFLARERAENGALTKAAAQRRKECSSNSLVLQPSSSRLSVQATPTST